MKACSVPLCVNNTVNRPDLRYFALPRNVNIREEWLEVIGVKGDYRGQHLLICEIHFRDLDFKAGKKELKAHAVPVLRLGTGKLDPVGSEDEFIPDSSSCEPEVMEIVELEEIEQKQVTPASIKKKRPIEEKEKVQPEPMLETEYETGRRPSRRAALVAAKKIFNTVRNYGVKDDIHEDPPSQPANPIPKPQPPTPRPPRQRKKANIDLDMYCEEEALTKVQSEFQCDAQNEYNLAMKNMRELSACKVRIIQTGMDPVNFNVPLNVFAQNGGDTKGGVKAQSNSKSSPKAYVPKVLPLLLAKNAKKPITPIIYL